jgi:phosphoribosylformylglycinamidine synthase
VETKATNLDALTKNKLNTISYADHQGKKTQNYPANPNGSLNGIAGVTNESGTITVMMPHPERAFLKDQFSWTPEEWSHYSPWIQFFLNARDFVD